MSGHNNVNIVVEGCCHGEFSRIYDEIENRKMPCDLLIVCGDLQTFRNELDMKCTSIPPKYQQLGTFHEYYSGTRIAPFLTVVIGGNHESSNYLQELDYGGWLAPNIFYLGAAGVINFRHLRIAGISGIYKAHDYHKGHFEKMPYDNRMLKSAYHVRHFDMFRLAQIKGGIDIMISHDWPAGIEQHGNLEHLLKVKKHFKEDVRKGELGSKPGWDLLMEMKPKYWFSGHLHVRFDATISHECPASTTNAFHYTKENNNKINENEIVLDINSCEEKCKTSKVNSNEIDLDIDSDNNDTPVIISNSNEIDLTLAFDSEDSKPVASGLTNKNEIDLDISDSDEESNVTPTQSIVELRNKSTGTRFLALDKCLPRRKFLEAISIPVPLDSSEPSRKSDKLYYDPEWLAITRVLNNYYSDQYRPTPLPTRPLEQVALDTDIQKEKKWVEQNIVAKNLLEIPDNFVHTAPIVEDMTDRVKPDNYPLQYDNPQTVEFCKLIKIQNKQKSKIKCNANK
ncbi:hypothetical protein NADFUDRAFT_46612 [Nadsonia fulvescens var. elongata DSM 6958]|uniref:Lariat debranching enzyme C-terminal domain-containing protein n=1 Tax=Nadsonia fulvescens var. elongata DSM 6958 TaxID=857566 RepID=A0A1E3PMA9_9ASCO|nr:hypothetical protein NADFUDRAFT_46612 [Nadsonia fulvescens var. elongata DSM 6958]